MGWSDFEITDLGPLDTAWKVVVTMYVQYTVLVQQWV